MSEAQEFAIHVIDLLQDFGRCEARRMFGGFGIFRQALMFGLIADGSLYLKADEHNRGEYEAESCEVFTYFKQGRPYRLSYYLVPESFFDDDQARLHWARSAFGAALRGADDKKKKKSRRSNPVR